MTAISLTDVLTLGEYERERPRLLKEIIALRSARRLSVGPWISVAFENHRTVLHQVQEMIRIESLAGRDQILHEIETYSELLPKTGELSATLFVEIDDPCHRAAALSLLPGIEQAVSLEVGSFSFQAFDKRPIDPRFARPGHAAAVYYLGIPFDAQAQAALDAGAPARLRIAHPRYQYSADLSRELAASLKEDVQ